MKKYGIVFGSSELQSLGVKTVVTCVAPGLLRSTEIKAAQVSVCDSLALMTHITKH